MAMRYQEMKEQLEELMNHDYINFVKAMISIETELEDEEQLERIVDEFLENDGVVTIVHEELYGKGVHFKDLEFNKQLKNKKFEI